MYVYVSVCVLNEASGLVAKVGRHVSVLFIWDAMTMRGWIVSGTRLWFDTLHELAGSWMELWLGLFECLYRCGWSLVKG